MKQKREEKHLGGGNSVTPNGVKEKKAMADGENEEFAFNFLSVDSSIIP